ncbi:MAG: hypothetical protein AAFU53_12980, partial [Cyanobacteria bacterium J06632_3]
MVTSFETFRATYPEGCLTTDLISIHDGQYIVRAAITHKDKVLATGLAASVDVQIAEDKARDRALEVLGILTTHTPSNKPLGKSLDKSQSNTATVTTLGTPANQPSANPSSASAPLQTATDSPTLNNPTLDKAATPDDEEIDVAIHSDETPILDETEDMGPPIDEIAEEPMAAPDARPSAAVIALENFNTSSTPV